jgi:hypothetical protein
MRQSRRAVPEACNYYVPLMSLWDEDKVKHKHRQHVVTACSSITFMLATQAYRKCLGALWA